jgi:hypothetical protein
MKINLKNTWKDKKTQRYQMFLHLVDEFCTYYDVEKSYIITYITQSDSHLEIFIGFLVDHGYKVSIFTLRGVNKDIISWGLDFDDQCDLTTLLKLKFLE